MCLSHCHQQNAGRRDHTTVPVWLNVPPSIFQDLSNALYTHTHGEIRPWQQDLGIQASSPFSCPAATGGSGGAEG